MNISKISSACALSLAVLALPAMALNTNQPYYNNGQRQNQGQRQNRENRLKAMDRNGDGMITRDEWTGDDASFRKHDRNGDGVISAADRQQNGQGRQHGQRNQNPNQYPNQY
jgi:hypothetical protein